MEIHPYFLVEVNGNILMKSRQVDCQAVVAHQPCQVIFSSVTPAQSHLNVYQNNPHRQL